MLDGPTVVRLLAELDVTHVVWLPDSALGPWEEDLRGALGRRLLGVCREGEAWALAAGLHLGGARPLVMIQNTGLFESGDALRNVLFDLGLPLWAWVGYRSYLVSGSTDTARQFTEPVLRAWGLDYLLIDSAERAPEVTGFLAAQRSAGKPGVVLVAEGRM